jgi:uncharacterized protein (TIGR03435 family)
MQLLFILAIPARARRVVTALIVGMALAGSTATAQAPASAPAFEVASIRPATFPPRGGPGGRGGGGGVKIDGERLDLPFVSLADLLPYAYRVKDYQISAPAWVHESRWSISAKLPDGASQNQAPEMMQALLAERFKLTVHREKREQPVYELTVASGGSKLEEASPGDYPAWDGSFPGFGFRGPLQSGAPITGRIVPRPNCTRVYEFVPLPMAAFADALTLFLGRPVMDETGLKGNYRVTLELPAEAEAGMMMNMDRGRGLLPPPAGAAGGRGGMGGEKGLPGPPFSPPPPPPREVASPGCPDPISLLLSDVVGAPDGAIIKAVQQLGLKLQQGRAPIDTIVVDHLEKTPTEN